MVPGQESERRRYFLPCEAELEPMGIMPMTHGKQLIDAQGMLTVKGSDTIQQSHNVLTSAGIQLQQAPATQRNTEVKLPSIAHPAIHGT